MGNTTTSLRILHCANFSERRNGAAYYAIDRKISNGLIRNHHFVQDFSYRDVARHHSPLRLKKFGIRKMNALLLETARQIQPDLLLLGHSELVSNETLERIRQAHPRCRIAMYWIDWIRTLLRRKAFFEQRLALLDCFFMTTDPAEVDRALATAQAGVNTFYLPNICDRSIDTGQAFRVQSYRHDVVFVGRGTERNDLIDHLSHRMADLNVGIYGQDKQTVVFGRAYLELLAASKIGINYSHANNIPGYSSDRIIQLAANGCLVVTPDTPGMTEYFSRDEVVYFKDLAEMEERIRFYLAHDAARRKLAEASWQRAHLDYESVPVTRNMLARIFT